MAAATTAVTAAYVTEEQRRTRQTGKMHKTNAGYLLRFVIYEGDGVRCRHLRPKTTLLSHTSERRQRYRLVAAGYGGAGEMYTVAPLRRQRWPALRGDFSRACDGVPTSPDGRWSTRRGIRPFVRSSRCVDDLTRSVYFTAVLSVRDNE